MHRPLIMVAALLLCAMPAVLAADQDAFENLSFEILDAMSQACPVVATGRGIHTYDDKLSDYSAEGVNRSLAAFASLKERLNDIDTTALPLAQRVDYRLLHANLDLSILELDKINWPKRSPQLYVDEALNGVYLIMISQHAPMEIRMNEILGRMRAVPALLSQAKQNLDNVAPIYIELATESLPPAIAFYEEVANELTRQFPDRSEEIQSARDLATKAMEDYNNWLATLTPGDEKRFSLGTALYEEMLLANHMLDMSADSLLAFGLHQLDSLDQLYQQQAALIDSLPDDDVPYFVPASFGHQDMIDYYIWETNKVREFIQQHNLLTIPENIAEVGIIETPPYLQSMIAGIAYQPAGPFDSLQTCLFYVRQLPDTFTANERRSYFTQVHNRTFKGSIVHEAYPGHHLQMQIATNHPDPVRKWQQNMMLIEGWALYCEEMVYHQGLYGRENQQQWLSIIGGARFRAARIVADVKLHTGQFTYQECVDWMIETLNVTQEYWQNYLRSHVRHICLVPTYFMSYLTGKQEIMAIRRAAEERDGDAFSLSAFHNELLAEGSISPFILRELMGLQK